MCACEMHVISLVISDGDSKKLRSRRHLDFLASRKAG